MKINEKIKNAREEKDWTQADLGDAVGVTRTYINLIENGKYISTKIIDKISEALGIDLTADMLNEINYYSNDTDSYYMSASQFKGFMTCEEKEMAKIKGVYIEPMSRALMEGSYIDARIEGEEAFEKFKVKYPEIFTKGGELKSEFKNADLAYDRIKKDEMFMSYLEGDKQVTMKGEIAGVPFKIKIDVLNLKEGRIVDFKYIKDFDTIWDKVERKQKHFIDMWHYDIQGAIYQEIVRQNTGRVLPFYIAATTKETDTDYEIIQIHERDLREALEKVIELAPRYQKIKQGELEPSKCNCCKYCKETKRIKEPTIYSKYVEELI